LSLSIQILDTTGNVSDMVSEIEKRNGVHNVKVLGRD
jgi:chorismate mutase